MIIACDNFFLIYVLLFNLLFIKKLSNKKNMNINITRHVASLLGKNHFLGGKPNQTFLLLIEPNKNETTSTQSRLPPNTNSTLQNIYSLNSQIIPYKFLLLSKSPSRCDLQWDYVFFKISSKIHILSFKVFPSKSLRFLLQWVKFYIQGAKVNNSQSISNMW